MVREREGRINKWVVDGESKEVNCLPMDIENSKMNIEEARRTSKKLEESTYKVGTVFLDHDSVRKRLVPCLDLQRSISKVENVLLKAIKVVYTCNLWDGTRKGN